MSAVVVVGASVAGLATAVAMRQRGHQVRVLERQAEPPDQPPGTDLAGWWPAIGQTRQSHTLTSLGATLVRDRVPALDAALRRAGALSLAMTAALPPTARGREPAPGDADLIALACRRVTLQHELYRLVRGLPGVSVEHGVRVHGLRLTADRRAVTGVAVDRRTPLPADVVIDASGQRAAGRGWLRAAGVPVAADLRAPAALRCFTRFYRLTGPGLPGPLNRGNAAGGIWDHYAAVVHPGDQGTFTVVLGVLPDDPMVGALRREAPFTAAARLSPGIGAWLDAGVSRPTSAVHAMTCRHNVLRGMATTRQQPVAGFFPVGDAACVTDPLFGRGVSLAFAHAFGLADLLAAQPDTGAGQSRSAAALAQRLYGPWYRQAARDDEERILRWRAAATGGPAPSRVGGRPGLDEIGRAAAADAVVWRQLVRVLMTLDPPTALAAADFGDRVRRALRSGAQPPSPAPGRARLLREISTAL
jgi:2-polyprenyl-6-methoxyphenol hydroxylase-like FAD-dependent oxidoreductase